ncbi:MAG: sulfatase-like hydrolase/transferase [bacterium]|nr:sulfatase-like hydrolase/transferase [bacterium]
MSKQKRRDFLKTVAMTSAYSVLPFSLSCKANKKRPNVVLIMADDLGQEVLGCYGGTSYQTPNIDKLAETGVKFTHCYGTPVCSPSRVTIMTGRYLFRTTEEWGHIPPDEKTFGHVLKNGGYATALAGKWQMSLLKSDPLHIQKMGFEQNCCFGWHEGPRYYEPLIWQNGKIREDVKDRFGPDVYCDFLIEFMKRNRDKPFLAYYPMALAHDISNDMESPPPPGPNGRYPTYKELVEYIDKLVGRIITALEVLGLREDTLVLFTGDNGTPKKFITEVKDGNYIRTPIVSKMNGKDVIGGKGELTDAGTHVPLIANCPGNSPSGAICSDLIDFTDFLPTMAELGKADLPENVIVDGRSFLPQIRGKRGNPRDWVYNQWAGNAWIRNKRWKLYKTGDLFDMEKDPFEKAPIKSSGDTDDSAEARKLLYHYVKELNPKNFPIPL